MTAYDPNRAYPRPRPSRNKYWWTAAVILVALIAMGKSCDVEPPEPRGAWCADNAGNVYPCTRTDREVYR